MHFSPRLGTRTGGHEVKIASSGPIFGLFSAETLSKSVLGTARTLCYAWQLPLHLPASHAPQCRVQIFFSAKKNIAVARGRHGATRAGRHRHGGTGRHRRGATGGATRGSARALPPIFPRWPCNARHAGPGKIARSAPDRGESCAQRARSGDKNSEKNSKKFFERI